MREKDSDLQYWSEQIDSLSAKYEQAKSKTSQLLEQMNSAWESLHDLQKQYREYKEQADYEFEQAQYCWSMHDGANAKEHSENGHLLNQKKADIGVDLDAAHARYDPLKVQFDAAVAYQRSIKAKLDQARDAFYSRLEELKAQNLQEQLHWKEKSCGRCGSTIRYHDTWEHIPNYCKSCKEAMENERKEREKKRVAEAAKWQEKPCKQCGKPIRYHLEWSHIPNFCTECKKQFENEKRQKEANKREKSCRICGKTIIYYTHWKRIPNYCKECYEKGSTWGRPAKAMQPKTGYSILDYSHGIKQQNSKDLRTGEFGEHKWYDPHTGQMGDAGPNFPGSKRKPRYD